MKKLEQLYEGKAKKVFATDDPNVVLVDYKDDATAFNGLKKGTIMGKGVINNRVTNFLMKMLEKNGIPTHYIEEISDRETLVKKVHIVPLEVIVRNIAAGSLSKRLGLPEGTKLKQTVLEYCYKDDELGDPMVNEYHIMAMGWVSKPVLDQIAAYALRINELLTAYLKEVNIELIDFKLEFGITNDGAKPYGIIFDLSVDPAYRGKRIGQELLQRATESFRDKGIQDCYLESGVNNHSAHQFFEHHGFKQVSDIFRLKL